MKSELLYDTLRCLEGENVHSIKTSFWLCLVHCCVSRTGTQ